MHDRLLFNPGRSAGIDDGNTAILGAARSLFLTQRELAHRWRLSGRTLEKWRWTKKGPAHVKLGGRIVYRLADVEAYEAERRCMGAVA